MPLQILASSTSYEKCSKCFCLGWLNCVKVFYMLSKFYHWKYLFLDNDQHSDVEF